MSLVSIIVPIYNVESYLKEAVDSLINQTIFDDLEVILVDDGSQDGSGVIAKTYAEKYANISYHYKENGGLSDARNFGLQFVSSKYTMFLDSDDMYTPRACEVLYHFAEENNLNIVIGNLFIFPGNTPNYDWKRYFGHGNRVIDLSVSGEELLKSPSACNKIFRTDLLRQKDEFFPVGRHFEDAFSIIPLMANERIIGLVDEKVYLYRQREDGSSIMNSIYTKEKNYYDYIDLIKTLHNQLIVDETNKQIVYGVQKFITKSFHGYLLNIFLKDHISFDEKERAWIFDQILPIYQNINYKMLDKLSEHRVMKTIYYALVTNNKSLFVNPILEVNRIIIRDQILINPEYLCELEMHSIHLYASIERFIEDNEDFVLIGELISNNVEIDHHLQNEFVFQLKGPKGRVVEYPVQKFNKLESPYYKDENDASCGIMVRIPMSAISGKDNHFELKMCIIEETTQEHRYIGVLAHNLLHQYKREKTQPISLNIRPNRTIELITKKVSVEQPVGKTNKETKVEKSMQDNVQSLLQRIKRGIIQLKNCILK